MMQYPQRTFDDLNNRVPTNEDESIFVSGRGGASNRYNNYDNGPRKLNWDKKEQQSYEQ